MDSDIDLEMGTVIPRVKETDSEYSSSSSIDNHDHQRYENGRLVFGVYLHWTPNQGPHQVFVDVDIEQLDKINTVNQTFRSSFTVTQSWLWSKEDEEHFNSNDTENIKLRNSFYPAEQKNISWQPNPLRFPNAETDSLEIREAKLVLRKYNQMMMVEKKTYVSGDFGEKFE